ncbi:MAG TPA: PTS sugar transporter subunit IIC, partial [Anaerolineae bacterium]
MSVFQAAFIALLYTFARSAFNAGLGGYILSQPLVAGTLAGLLLGDPLSGAALGGAINLGTLALSNLRTRFGPDAALIGYVGVSLMLLGGVKVDSPDAVLVFSALAVIGLALNFLRGAANSVLAHWADFFAERGDATIVSFINIAPTQAWLAVISFLAAFVLLRFDVKTLLNTAYMIPHWVQSALMLSQYLLAALGIATSLRLIMQGSSVAYFLLGWLGAQVFGLVPVT